MYTDVYEFASHFGDSEESVVSEKLGDALNAPGVPIEFDPSEAELAGAYPDDAVSIEEAEEAAIDLIST